MLWIGIAIGVVVVIVIIGALAYVGSTSTSIVVTAVNFTSSDNACSAGGSTGPGFTIGSGSSQLYTLTLFGGLIFSCTVTTVSATTSGFSISGANVPLTVPADGSQTLSFTINAPSGTFTGVLTIDIE